MELVRFLYTGLELVMVGSGGCLLLAMGLDSIVSQQEEEKPRWGRILFKVLCMLCVVYFSVATCVATVKWNYREPVRTEARR